MGVIVQDSFDRADNAASLGTADVGGAYTQGGIGGSAFGILSNKARFTIPGDSACGYINCGTPNVRITCTFTTSTTKSNAGLAARITDANNLIQLQFYNDGVSTNGLYLQKHIAAVDTLIASGLVGSIALATTYQVVWTINGPNHTVNINGTDAFTGSDSNAQDTVTNHGLWIYTSSGATDTAEARWNDLIIETSLVDHVTPQPPQYRM